MKKTTFILILVIISGYVTAQEEGIEAGDREVTVSGFFVTQVGVEYDYASGNVFLSYGKYTTQKLLIGFAPGLSITTIEGEVKVDLSAQFFINYNFVVNKKNIPYMRLSWYQATFDIPEEDVLTDYSWVQGGLGLKAFLSENIAWDTSLNIGKSLAEDMEGAQVMLMTGITFIF